MTMEKTTNLKMNFPIKLLIFQPAMLVYCTVSGADARIQLASFFSVPSCAKLLLTHAG